MTKNSHADGSNKPKSRPKGRGPDEDRDPDDEEACVELRCCQASDAELKIAAIELSDDEEADAHEDHVKEKLQVGQQAVNCEHDCDGKVIALEVAQVPINPALNLAEVGRLGKTFYVEEFADRLEICKARSQGLGANTFETGLQIQARGECLDRNADS